MSVEQNSGRNYFETEMDHHQKDARSGFMGQVTGQIWSAFHIKRIGQISLRKMV